MSETETTNAVEFNGVSKSFDKRKVIDELSFKVEAATGYVLLGRSGTGKSVTLKLICGLLKADAGTVKVAGTDITAMDSTALTPLRKNMGFLFQSAALFDSISVGANIAFALQRNTDKSAEEIKERAQAVLDSVGLGKEYDKMPSDLSGGMRKRAGLARALALEPSILLVDEPSAGLDPITSAEIDDLLLNVKKHDNTTLIVVTHNIPSARVLGDRLAFLDNGRILAEGTAEELEQSEHQMVRDFMKSKQGG